MTSQNTQHEYHNDLGRCEARLAELKLRTKGFRRVDEAHCDALRPQLRQVFYPNAKQHVFSFEAEFTRAYSTATSLLTIKHAFQRALKRYRRAGPFLVAAVMFPVCARHACTHIQIKGLIMTGVGSIDELKRRVPRPRTRYPSVIMSLIEELPTSKQVNGYIDNAFVRFPNQVTLNTRVLNPLLLDSCTTSLIADGQRLKRILAEGGPKARWCFLGMRCDGSHLKVLDTQETLEKRQRAKAK
jgi:hypothetical protein